MADVAARCKVSSATASRAFAAPEKVSPDTRSRILKAASELGYVPTRVAADLDTMKAWQLTVLFQQAARGVPGGDAAFVERMLSGVELGCQELGCRLQTAILRRREYSPEEILALCGDSHGVVAVSCAGHLPQLAKVAHHMPVVALNDIVRQPGVGSFADDSFGAINLAVVHLRDLGHERIVYFHINDARPANPGLVRRHGAFEAIRNSPDTYLPHARAEVPRERDVSMVEYARRRLQAWMAEDAPPTAMICGNDSYALGFQQAAQSLGIDVPGQFSIIGVDDYSYAAELHPPLTSIRCPLEVLGSDAVRHLVGRLDGSIPTADAMHYYPMALIKRASTGPAPKRQPVG